MPAQRNDVEPTLSKSPANSAQAPAEQACPAAHCTPHPPQLFGSLPSCTQLLPQAT